ncbi:hypothetical protein AD998_03520 [bacterium 336/3]|nr:hypothetical protein AD998_03520 [bacterium 336/3]
MTIQKLTNFKASKILEAFFFDGLLEKLDILIVFCTFADLNLQLYQFVYEANNRRYWYFRTRKRSL